MSDGISGLEILACGLRPEASVLHLLAMIAFIVAAARLRRRALPRS